MSKNLTEEVAKVKEVTEAAVKKVEDTAKDEETTKDVESIKKEGAEAGAATKSFFKEVGEFFAAIGHAIACFVKRLFTKKA